ncbi:dCTP deaminase domain-containing protein [Aeromonas veronii]
MTILSNNEILSMINSHRNSLIKNFDRNCIGASTYELRMGDTFFDLTENNKREALRNNQNVIIKPGHRVVLITKEELDIPDNIVARIISKGSLFTIGLSPVATMADPGFKGKIGLVTQNLSDKYIVLNQGEKLAKVEFSFLSSSSSKPYQGQHGFQLQQWPYRDDLVKSYEEILLIAREGQIKSELEEASIIMPKPVINALNKIKKKQKNMAIIFIAFAVINVFMTLMIYNEKFETAYGLISSFVVNILSSIAMFYFTRESKN